MRFFHGGPIWPEQSAPRIWDNTGALVSFARPEQVLTAYATARQVILDNGAFNAWKSDGKNKTWEEWLPYLDWTKFFSNHPRHEFSIVPDGIECGEKYNKELAVKLIDHVGEKELHKWGVVWHLDESYNYLRWCIDNFSIVCLGSTSKYPPGSHRWRKFMRRTWTEVIINEAGYPKVRIHGLRMLRKSIVKEFPFYSCDSSFVATHMNDKDPLWRGCGKMPNAKTRGCILRDDIENNQSAAHYNVAVQNELF